MIAGMASHYFDTFLRLKKPLHPSTEALLRDRGPDVGTLPDPAIISTCPTLTCCLMDGRQAMTVVSFFGTVYLVREDDVEQRTKRVFTSQR